MKTIKTLIVLLLILINSSLHLFSQQSVVSAGGDFTGSGGSMSFSTGLTDFYFYESAAGSLQFGLQHAFLFTGDLPPDEELLQDMTIADGESSCFAALMIITTAGDGETFLVESGGRADLISAGKIIMLHGTKVELGGALHARITTDGTFCPEPDKHFLTASVMETDDVALASTNDDILPAMQENFFRVYPNPTTGRFTLELSHLADISEKALAEIYGMRGERVLREEITSGQHLHEFSLEGKLPGIYIIRVMSGNQYGVGRIIKR